MRGPVRFEGMDELAAGLSQSLFRVPGHLMIGSPVGSVDRPPASPKKYAVLFRRHLDSRSVPRSSRRVRLPWSGCKDLTLADAESTLTMKSVDSSHREPNETPNFLPASFSATSRVRRSYVRAIRRDSATTAEWHHPPTHHSRGATRESVCEGNASDS